MRRKRINWATVGNNVRRIYEGVEVVDILYRIESVDKALPKDVTAVILERLFGKFGCYASGRYVLCDKPLGVKCRQRGRLYWCVVEEPWFFSDRPLPICVELSNGYLCAWKDAEVALKRFDEGDCDTASAKSSASR